MRPAAYDATRLNCVCQLGARGDVDAKAHTSHAAQHCKGCHESTERVVAISRKQHSEAQPYVPVRIAERHRCKTADDITRARVDAIYRKRRGEPPPCVPAGSKADN
mgnify:CR=1 FL=1